MSLSAETEVLSLGEELDEVRIESIAHDLDTSYPTPALNDMVDNIPFHSIMLHFIFNLILNLDGWAIYGFAQRV